VLVELFISEWDGQRYETTWWDRLRRQWPADMEAIVIEGLPVAPMVVLEWFRESYADVIDARPW
jgi:hypothetical protein